MEQFFRKHRRKFIGTGVLVGGSYALYRYLRYKMEQHLQQKVEELNEQKRRSSNFSANQESCLQTVVSFLPNLQTIIARTFDSQQLRASLDENPAKKKEIWMELMVLSVCRCVSSVYSVVLLYMLVRVQVNILAAEMYKRNNQHLQSISSLTSSSDSSIPASSLNRSSDDMSEDATDHQLRKSYLSEMKYFLTDGLKSLFEIINRSVRQHLKTISLKDKMSLLNIESLMRGIKSEVDMVLDCEASSSFSNQCLGHHNMETIGKFNQILLPSKIINQQPASKAALEMESGSDLSIDNKCGGSYSCSSSSKGKKSGKRSSILQSYLSFRKNSLLKTVYPRSLSNQKRHGSKLDLKTLLNQTKDVMDLADFSSTVIELTEHGLSFLTRTLAEHSFVDQSNDADDNTDFQSITMPMAKWVPVLDAQLYTLCQYDHHINCLVMSIHLNKTVNLFSENVYEAFIGD